MNRLVAVTVDSASWPAGVPVDINALTTPSRSTNVLSALLHTALWTKPPVQYGFDLSDFWAWLRYGPAIADTPSLRLRQEWTEIDPHQKTVLSDELGVGFTSELFVQELGFRLYGDAQYVVNVATPGRYTLKRSGKRGPSKSPDYLAVDGNGRVHVLECKGTHSSVEALETATANGVAQKKNLTAGTGTPLTHCLVAGLFIPQWTSSEGAMIRVRDPEPHDLAEDLARMDQALTAADIVQVALAKHFSLMGLTGLVNWLATTRLEELRAVPRDLQNDAEGLNTENDQLNVSITRTGPRLVQDGRRSRQLRFQMSYPRDLYARFVESNNVYQMILDMAANLASHPWKVVPDESRVDLQTPLTFNMALEWV